MTSPAERLAALNITLPSLTAPVANYVPWVISGSLLYISGQLPFADGQLTAIGHLGGRVTLEQGQAAARQCAINLIAQINAATGGQLDRVKRVVRLNAFVSSTPGFIEQPKVVNGASDLFVAVFGDAGRHSRTAVGVAVLPLNAAVEIDAIIELADA